MKKYSIVALIIVLFACTQNEKGFKINVNLDGASGKIVLEERGAEGWVGIDTADIVDGTAVLKGAVETPKDMYVSLLGERAKAIVFVENTEMSLVGKADSIYKAKITGSATHDEFEAMNQKLQKVSEEYMAIYQEARAANAAGDTAKANQLMKRVNEMYESTNTMQEDFVKENPASYVSPYFLNRIQYGKDVDELETLVNGLDEKLQIVPSVVALKEQIAKLKKVAVGQIAPDFTQNDVDGNPVKFSDVYSKNEVTLLDFWASWCGPCRGENPNVVAVFNDYNKKGFTVFGVSLDRDKDKWVKAIADDQLTWTHVSDLKYWDNEVSQMYAIRSIPSNLLVDKTGKIIAKNKRGEELRKFVAGTLD